MHENIYYVGSSTHTSQFLQALTQRLPSDHTSHRNRPTSVSKDKNNNTKSTSCPKTQRSRFMQSVQQIRKMSPAYRRNQEVCRRAFGREKQNCQQEEVGSQEEKSKLSSAFQVVPKHQMAQYTRREGRVKFRKVEQPRPKPTRIQYKTENPQNYIYEHINENRTGSRPKVERLSKRTPAIIQSIKVGKKVSFKQPQQQQKNEHQILKSYPNYRIQPIRQYFICSRCYELFSIIELDSHQSDNCQIPLKKSEFISKWKTLYEILQQIEQKQPNNALFRLIDRMKWYIDGQQNKKQGYILYSEELATILSLKGRVNLKYISEEDLFWLIESIGDLLETQVLDLSETAFWKICT